MSCARLLRDHGRALRLGVLVNVLQQVAGNGVVVSRMKVGRPVPALVAPAHYRGRVALYTRCRS